MPYNSIVSASNAASLVPVQIAAEILQHIPELNPVMRLARRLPNMSTSQTRLPVVSALASAYFVSGATGLKQTSQMTWENKYIDAEELAVIVPIPQTVLDDSSYDLWANIRPEIERAISVAITGAVLYGTNIPTTWTTNMGAAGLQAVCAASAPHSVSLAAFGATDIYDALLSQTAGGTLGVFTAIEQDGFGVTGSIANLATKGLLRGCRDTEGGLIFKANVQDATRYELDGAPVYFPTDGSMAAYAAGVAGLFAGQWDQLVYAMRQDITFSIATTGVIQDAAGAIVYNLFQQDMIAMRCVIRLGFALPNPISRVTSSGVPFAMLTA